MLMFIILTFSEEYIDEEKCQMSCADAHPVLYLYVLPVLASTACLFCYYVGL